MGQTSTLIFDFDGTLADTFHIATSVFRELAGNRQSTDDARIEQLRSLPAKEALKVVGVRWWNLPYVVYRGRKAVLDHMKRGEVKAIAGVVPVMRELRKRGYRMLVVSSNSNKNIERFLLANKLDSYFDGYHGGVGLFSKAVALTNIVRQKNLELADCTYIGDEVRDAEAARHAHMPFVGVTWGYNNRKALNDAHVDTLVDDPKGLLSIFSAKLTQAPNKLIQ